MAKVPPPLWIEPFTCEQEVYLWMLFYGLASDDAELIEQALVQILERCSATRHAKNQMLKRWRAEPPSKESAELNEWNQE